jgi:predicted hotdog family 3-hydroxylacyl-ACP dehydratase
MSQHPLSTPIGRDVLRTLLPHAGSMCLLESVASWNAREIVCHATSHRASDHPLRLGDRLDALAAIEYAAQASAIHGTLRAPLGAHPRGGFLASVQRVELAVARLDDVETPLVVTARQLAESDAGCSYDFEVSARDARLVTGRLLIAYPKR